METVLIVIHLIVVLALVGLVLIQRSEGGGLGIGGGGGGGFMTARGTGNTLTRTTSILAAAFFLTSLGLSVLARYGSQPTDILDRVPSQSQDGGSLLDSLGGGVSQQPTESSEPVPPTVPGGEETPAGEGAFAPDAEEDNTTPTGIGVPEEDDAPNPPAGGPVGSQVPSGG